MIETLLLITLTAFIPINGEYALWNIEVTNDRFTAIQDGRAFIVVGYSPDQFTEKLWNLWQFEEYRVV